MPVPEPASLRHDRSRAHVFGKALLSNYGLTAVNIATYVVTVRWYVRWLGADRFGLWLIFLQVLYTASLATMWIAAPLTRHAASCYVEDDRRGLAALFGTASAYYAALGVIALGLVGLGSGYAVSALHVNAALLAEGRRTLLVVALSFCVSVQLNILLSFLVGYQRMHLSNALQAAVTVVSGGLGAFGAYWGFGLAAVAGAQLAANVAVYATACVVVFRLARIDLTGTWFDPSLLATLLRTGSKYLAYCVSYLLLQSDTVLVGFVLGPRAAAMYGVAFRIVDQIVQLVWRIPDAWFPVTTELAARGEMARFKLPHRISSKLALAIALVAACLFVFFGSRIVAMWVGPTNTPPQSALTALSAVLLTQVFVHSNVIVPYGANRMGSVATVALVEAVTKIGLSLALLPRLGISGVAVATVIAQMVFTGWYAAATACRLTGDRLPTYLNTVLLRLLPPAAILWLSLWSIGQDGSASFARIVVGVPAAVLAYAAFVAAYGLHADERHWILVAINRVRTSPASDANPLIGHVIGTTAPQ